MILLNNIIKRLNNNNNKYYRNIYILYKNINNFSIYIKNNEIIKNKKNQLLIYNINDKFIDYSLAWKWQKYLIKIKKLIKKKQLKKENVDILLLLSHNNIYTLGKYSNKNNIKFYYDFNNNNNNNNIPFKCYEIERGGEVTWHGPGQLIGYPIFDLNLYKKDLHLFLRNLEEIIILTLFKYGIYSKRENGNTGVWTSNKKIAAIGLSASQWITMHGFSLNINPNLQNFYNIIPCGIKNRHVTSMEYYTSNYNDNDIRNEIINNFQKIFNVNIIIPKSNDPMNFLNEINDI